MSPWERFFKLLYSIMSMVMSGAVRIQWVNDCFQLIVSSPRPASKPVIMPPRTPKGFKRKTLKWELSEEDWAVLEKFFEGRTYFKVVKFFHDHGNVQTSRKALIDNDILNSWPDVGQLNCALSAKNLPYALRTREKSTKHADYQMQFCILENNPYRSSSSSNNPPSAVEA